MIAHDRTRLTGRLPLYALKRGVQGESRESATPEDLRREDAPVRARWGMRFRFDGGL
jgi:hypothetical protein